MIKISTLLIIAAMLFCTSCSDTPSSSDSNQNNTTKKEVTPPIATNGNDVAETAIKAGAPIVGKIFDNAEENKRRRDSIKQANSTHTWVYQIGESYEKSDLAGNELSKLKNISNIYIFKKSKHEYYLIKDDGYQKEQLEDSLGDFKRKVQSFETRVSILDLGTLCSGKKKPSVSKSIKYKIDGKKQEIECRECE